MNIRFAVVGSNSFSGSHFVDHLLNEGLNTIGISRSPEPADAFLPYKWKKKDNFEFHQLDLKQTDKIADLLESKSVTHVVNFAAQSMVAQSWDSPEDWYQTNVVSNVKLFEKLRKYKSLEKYVHISTPEVYGTCEGALKENRRYNPSTPYATSRAACDMHLMNLFNNYTFPVVFTRAANVFGPGQQLYRIIPRTILYIKMGKKLQLHGGGTSVRSFIHIKDVAVGTLSAALRAAPPDIFHFSTDRFVSIRQLVELICEKMNVNFDEHVDVSPERPGKDAAYVLDTEKAQKTLDWQASISLEKGIEETIEWIDLYYDELVKQPMNYIHKK